MSGTRGGLGRIVAMVVVLGLALLLLVAREATAAKYTVAQCGWHVDADADWADTTGGAKFRPDAYCATPAAADPFDGAHLKSFTRGGASTVSGTRFARWRWVAPAGTGITRVSGTWWHTLHDGFEQRIGVGTPSGGFAPFATAASTDVTLRDFVAGFSPPMPALEDRLLCARGASKWCSLEPGSWSAARALTITIQDDAAPSAGIGGPLTSGGWRRGSQAIQFWGADVGGGIRFGESMLDGARVALFEYPCAKAMIGGEWRGTRMRPCEPSAAGGANVATTNFSDGPHALGHCASDFAGNTSCLAPITVLIDNNPPGHPRDLALAGGESWRRVNDFDLAWANPDQGSASAIGGASWRVTGPGGYDSGVHFAPGRGLTALRDLRLAGSGSYSVAIWLRDEAGNEASASAVSVPLRLDDVAPGVAFAVSEGTGMPDVVQADVSDPLSGPAGGSVRYRRLGTTQWLELPSRLQAADPAGSAARLTAHVPGDLAPGTYLFRAEAVDAAGNSATSTRRADGVEMALRKTASPAAAKKVESPRGKTRVFARLRWRRHRGARVTVPFGAAAVLSGRLLDADGAGLTGRHLRVVARPSRGALTRRRVFRLRTGSHGGFRLPMPSGPSRRITVNFAGESGLDGARRPALALRVRGGVVLHAAPRSLRTGQTVHVWGRVRARGAPLPRRGKLVAIQYYETAARRWRPILVTRSDHNGRYRTGYRFRYVSGTARVRLRAVALAEERWPYAPGASPPVSVRVSG
jgi:hypothetical protein